MWKGEASLVVRGPCNDYIHALFCSLDGHGQASELLLSNGPTGGSMFSKPLAPGRVCLGFVTIPHLNVE